MWQIAVVSSPQKGKKKKIETVHTADCTWKNAENIPAEGCEAEEKEELKKKEEDMLTVVKLENRVATANWRGKRENRIEFVQKSK